MASALGILGIPVISGKPLSDLRSLEMLEECLTRNRFTQARANPSTTRMWRDCCSEMRAAFQVAVDSVAVPHAVFLRCSLHRF